MQVINTFIETEKITSITLGSLPLRVFTNFFLSIVSKNCVEKVMGGVETCVDSLRGVKNQQGVSVKEVEANESKLKSGCAKWKRKGREIGVVLGETKGHKIKRCSVQS